VSRIRRSLACGLALAAVLDPARAAADPERYLLALFHFNLQYVPGGLHGFPDGTGSGGPDYDLTNDEVEDRIITESFEPLLDTCLDHPEIAIDIELQGYFLDVLAARHPGVIGKLKTLTANGQVELVSIHYSDQLFLAFPRVDLERSFALDEAAFARAGLPRAEVSFAQEGQFGEGLLDFLAAHGFRGALMPKNLLHYLHRGLPFAARYDAGSGLPTVALAGEGGADPSGAVAVDWSFFDDGELWASDRLSPYFGKRYAFNPAERDAFVARIQSAIAAGFTPATVSRYLDRLEALAVPRPPLPPILDGTWQPGSTDTMHKWLGGSGLFDAFGPGEKDNVVRTRNARGHAALVAAEAALSSMDGGQRADGQKRIDTGWRELALGEVTDATGINPYRTEVEYGIAHSDAAIAWAESALGLLWPKLSGPVEIDSGTGSVGPAPAAGRERRWRRPSTSPSPRPAGPSWRPGPSPRRAAPPSSMSRSARRARASASSSSTSRSRPTSSATRRASSRTASSNTPSPPSTSRTSPCRSRTASSRSRRDGSS
jgi:hypothetical protein